MCLSLTLILPFIRDIVLALFMGLHWNSKINQEMSKMLILTRRIGETLMVGEEVTVTVLGVNGNQVRIGVDAPKNVEVHREEIYNKIQREKGSRLAATA